MSWESNAAVMKADREQNPKHHKASVTLARKSAKAPPSANTIFANQLELRRRDLGTERAKSILPLPVPEYAFAEEIGRKWRFDFAWPKLKVALEVDGQVHRIDGRWRSDMHKFNVAMFLGWDVLHVRPEDVRCGRALRELETLLSAVGRTDAERVGYARILYGKKEE